MLSIFTRHICPKGLSSIYRITIRRVDQPNPEYRNAGGQVVNWFDRDDEIVREGYFSIRDSMEAVKANPEAIAVFNELMAPIQAKAMEAYGDVAKSVQVPEEMQKMMNVWDSACLGSERERLRQRRSLLPNV